MIDGWNKDLAASGYSVDLYDDIPQGWEVVEEFVAPYYLNPHNKEDGDLGESFNELYGKGFWGVMPSEDMEGNPKYHLLDVIARKSDDELPSQDEFTQAIDTGDDSLSDDSGSKTINEKDVLRRHKLETASGEIVDIVLVRGGRYDENA